MPLADFPTAVRVRVPAKINLHLGVGPLRPDGYHDLVTVFQAVTIFDEVLAQHARGLHLAVSGAESLGVPEDSLNLAWRAAELIADHEHLPADVALEIRKSIPVAGGMAGGSADAAATMVACASLWNTELAKTDLLALAGQLGSDVAFPLAGGTALGTGRGDQLTPVLTTGEFHWVFALADYGISSAEAYAELDRMRESGTAPEPIGAPNTQLDALRSGDCERLASTLANDLEPAALSLRPLLREVLDAGRQGGALGAMVSGSGPTCAFLCSDAIAAALLRTELESSAVCRSAVTATGPTHGARVVV
jgi:4-diphosphocytidyl-2-C-methyl-D-erythritol kinase